MDIAFVELASRIGKTLEAEAVPIVKQRVSAADVIGSARPTFHAFSFSYSEEGPTDQ